VGKSRLLWELTHSHRTRDWLVLEAGSVSYGKGALYLPVVGLLKGYFQIHDRDTLRQIREKIRDKILGLDRELEPWLPALFGLLDVAAEDAEWQRLEARERRQRILDAVKRVLLRESRSQAVLLLFEDLHWIDSETQALLDSLVESLPAARVALLVSYRPEYAHPWGSRTYYSQLRLDPLPAERAETLVTDLLGDHPSLEALKRRLVERTAGNPFFLEESVRALVERGDLAGERGALRLTRPLGATQVPPTVQIVLAARIDRLSIPDKELLQAAAAIGKDVPLPLLEAVAGLDINAFSAGLTRLQAGEFLYEASLFPDIAYTFKHALTHEVAYDALLSEHRRNLHARILGAMEQLHAGRLEEQAERLVEHAFRGEAWAQATIYAQRAALRAHDRLAYASAVQYLDQALDALGRLPESREMLERRLEIMSQRHPPLFVLGQRVALRRVRAGIALDRARPCHRERDRSGGAAHHRRS
jgi:predicted ATPase